MVIALTVMASLIHRIATPTTKSFGYLRAAGVERNGRSEQRRTTEEGSGWFGGRNI
jgi:hypothetical protein